MNKLLLGLISFIITLTAGFIYLQVMQAPRPRSSRISPPAKISSVTDNSQTKQEPTAPVAQGTRQRQREALQFDFTAGKRFTEAFTYRMVTDYTFIFDENQKTTHTLVSASGKLEITCYSSADSPLIGYRLRNFDITLTGENGPVELMPKIQTDFRQEIFLEKGPQGKIGKIYFGDIHAFVANFWQQLIYIKHLVLPPKASARWQFHGTNTLGSYWATFTCKPSSGALTLIQRNIARYDSVKFQASSRFQANTQTIKLSEEQYDLNIKANITRYCFDRQRGYPAKIEMTDTAQLSLTQPFNLKLSYQTAWTSELKSVLQLAPQAIMATLLQRWGVDDWRKLKKQLHSVQVGQNIVAQQLYSNADKAKAEKEFTAILDSIRASLKSWDPHKISQLFQQAAELARISPRIIDMIAQELDMRDDIKVKGFLTDLLADVGSPKAQKVLRMVFTDTATPQTVRERAVFSSTFVKAPDPSFRKALLAMLQEAPENSQLGMLALRSIGAVSHKFKDSNPGVAQEMLKHLIAYKEKAYTADQKMALIDALGNTHMDDCWPHLKAFLDQNEPLNVRMTAMATLADSNSDRALEIVRTTLENTPSRQLVGTALEVFLQKRWQGHSTAAKMRLLRTIKQILPQYNDARIKELAERFEQQLSH